MDRTVEIEDMLRAVGGGSSGGGSAATSRPAQAAQPVVARPAPRRDASPVSRAPNADVPAPRPAAAAVLADAPPTSGPRPVPLELHLVTQRWDELVQRVRAAGMSVLASALENGAPSAVSARGGGEVVIQQTEPNPFHAEVIEEKQADFLAVLREFFTGVARISVSTTAQGDAPKRLTDEMIRSQRLARLRQQNPLLGAAIDVLDLDVVD